MRKVMSQKKTINTISGKLTFKKGDWKYITSAYFYSLDVRNNLTWESMNPNIALINPNSGLIYAKNIGETTVIGVSSDETIMVLCAIQVQPDATKIANSTIGTPDTAVMSQCGGNCSNDVSALGYSGTVFAYSEVGIRITLEKGFGAKNGTRNTTSDLFRSTLAQMNNIYASMSPSQRGAWLELRLHGLLGTIISLLTNSPEDYIIDYIKDALVNHVLPLEEIEALIGGFHSWYIAEQNAIAYYEAF